MARYEVISSGIYVKEGSILRELNIGEIIDDAPPQWNSKLRVVPDKVFEVSTPQDKTIIKKNK